MRGGLRGGAERGRLGKSLADKKQQQQLMPLMTKTTGDAALRAGVAHAVVVLGGYRVVGTRRDGDRLGAAQVQGGLNSA